MKVKYKLVWPASKKLFFLMQEVTFIFSLMLVIGLLYDMKVSFT